VAKFVDLYTGEGVADLPPGEQPIEPLAIHVAQAGSETSGLDPKMVADLRGSVSGGDSKVDEVSFLAIGEFNSSRKAFDYFALLLNDDLGKDTDVQSCRGIRIEDWGDGGMHAVIELQIAGDTYTARDFGCVISKLPEETGREADFIVSRFKDIAASMVADGAIATVSHEGLRALLEGVAGGRITIDKR
jgi:hypothetical protein